MSPAHKKERQKKKPTNVSVRADLLIMAREDNLNLSGMLECSLIDYCKKKREREWLNENKKAISDMNKFVEDFGVFSDGRKLF